jgi:hypothetical protein
MKIKFSISTLRGLRSSKFVATIYPSKKTGVRRRHRKTWNLRNVAPEHTLSEMKQSATAEAKRWEAKILASYQPDKSMDIPLLKNKQKSFDDLLLPSEEI